ncbi:hypothetical protein H4582DRAFT_2089273 [Lactarius indigo]|nr:hypothetical protein H4582DRAFT_2089273 [Lactarius indigo]
MTSTGSSTLSPPLQPPNAQFPLLTLMGVRDHFGEIQNDLHNLADYMHDKEIPQVVPPPPVHLKDCSVGGSSVVSLGGPREAPDHASEPPTPALSKFSEL